MANIIEYLSTDDPKGRHDLALAAGCKLDAASGLCRIDSLGAQFSGPAMLSRVQRIPPAGFIAPCLPSKAPRPPSRELWRRRCTTARLLRMCAAHERFTCWCYFRAGSQLWGSSAVPKRRQAQRLAILGTRPCPVNRAVTRSTRRSSCNSPVIGQPHELTEHIGLTLYIICRESQSVVTRKPARSVTMRRNRPLPLLRDYCNTQRFFSPGHSVGRICILIVSWGGECGPLRRRHSGKGRAVPARCRPII